MKRKTVKKKKRRELLWQIDQFLQQKNQHRFIEQ